jgi:5'-nucleotidase
MAPITANLAKLRPDQKPPLLNVAFSATTIFRGGWNKDEVGRREEWQEKKSKKEIQEDFDEWRKKEIEKSLEEWRKRQIEQAAEPMSRGPAYPFFRKLLMLNHFYTPEDAHQPLVKAHVVSKQDPAVISRFLNSLNHYGLLGDMEKYKTQCFYTSGGDLREVLLPLGVDLFLSSDLETVKQTLAQKIPSAYMDPQSKVDTENYTDTKLNIALDGDSVIFDEQMDVVYNRAGLPSAQQREFEFRDHPLNPGPLHSFLLALGALRTVFPLSANESPLNLILVTARGLTGQWRATKSFQKWQIPVDKAYFLNGGPKGTYLKHSNATIFFDDTERHIHSAQENGVPAAYVPHEKREGM